MTSSITSARSTKRLAFYRIIQLIKIVQLVENVMKMLRSNFEQNLINVRRRQPASVVLYTVNPMLGDLSAAQHDFTRDLCLVLLLLARYLPNVTKRSI